MPFTFQWLNEDQDIFVTKYTGRWTWEEVAEVDGQARALYRAANHRTDAICDLSASAWVPARFVENVRKLTETGYPNLHLVVFIAGALMRDLIATYDSQFNPLPYRLAFAENMAEAIEMIHLDREQADPDGG